MITVARVPLHFPQDPSFTPELDLLRRDAENALFGSTNSSLTSQLDILHRFADALLQQYQSFENSQFLATSVSCAIINMASVCQKLSEQLLHKAYREDSREAWARSGSYNKKSIGLLQFLMHERISETAGQLEIIQTCLRCWSISQQLGLVLLSIAKLKSQVYNFSDGSKDPYERLLELQTSDLKELSTNSVLYSRLCIGCRDACTQLVSQDVGAQAETLTKYLNVLIFTLLSLDFYKQDKCGVAIGMLDFAIQELSQGLVTTKQLKKITESRQLKHIVTSKIKEFRQDAKQLRSKFKLMRKPNGTATCNSSSLDSFMQTVFDDFVIPLIMLLRCRFQKTNDKVFFDKVVQDRLELIKLWPQGKSPDCTGTVWVFNGLTITESQASAAEYF